MALKNHAESTTAFDPPDRGSIMVRNEGMRSLRIISDLEFESAMLMPGEALEIADPSRAMPAITVFDGGLQIDFEPRAGRPAAGTGRA